MPGTNAKMNEIQALMGIQVLKYLEEIIRKRSAVTDLYRQRLSGIPGIRPPRPLSSEVKYNHAYFPVEIDEQEFGMSRDAFYKKLMEYNVYSRRYFYPLVCDYACYQSVSVKDPLTVARKVSECILTLPIYDSLELTDVNLICDIIESVQAGCRSARVSVGGISRK